MRKYETIVITDPDLSDDDRESVYEKVRDLISDQGGFLIESDVWGTQKLAYEIRKKVRGHYVRLEYCGTGALVSEMERSFRINDRILKYMTVLLEKEVDAASLRPDEEEQTQEEPKPEKPEDQAQDEAAEPEEKTSPEAVEEAQEENKDQEKEEE